MCVVAAGAAGGCAEDIKFVALNEKQPHTVPELFEKYKNVRLPTTAPPPPCAGSLCGHM